jgi:16S rRNA (cytidine1402-2'-O)-methyltransferase
MSELPSPGQPGSLGRLVLMPNTLDLGRAQGPLGNVLPLGVIEQATRIHHWAAENARSTRAFLKRVADCVPLELPLQSIQVTELPRARKGSGEAVTSAQWAALLAPALAGHDVGLQSEAGLPGVADPGAELVAQAHAMGVVVLALPGPSSLLLALASSGLNGQSFSFVGYLPQEAGARTQRVRELEVVSRRAHQTQICIETPYRNTAFFDTLLQALSPTTRLSISVGLTMQQAATRTATVAAFRAKPMHLPADVPAVFLWLAD